MCWSLQYTYTKKTGQWLKKIAEKICHLTASLESVIEAGDPAVSQDGRAHAVLEHQTHWEHWHTPWMVIEEHKCGGNVFEMKSWGNCFPSNHSLCLPYFLKNPRVIRVVVVSEVDDALVGPVLADPRQRCSPSQRLKRQRMKDGNLLKTPLPITFPTSSWGRAAASCNIWSHSDGCRKLFKKKNIPDFWNLCELKPWCLKKFRNCLKFSLTSLFINSECFQLD